MHIGTDKRDRPGSSYKAKEKKNTGAFAQNKSVRELGGKQAASPNRPEARGQFQPRDTKKDRKMGRRGDQSTIIDNYGLQ